MTLRIVRLWVVVGGVIGLVLQSDGARAATGPQAAMTAESLATCALAGTEFEYAGTRKCKTCHVKHYKSWEQTKHASAFDVLKPGEAKEAKEKHGLDAAKDYTTDESCLPCHTVGFGKKGGYAVPDASDEKAVKAAAKLAGVGCECCHGPGKAANKIKKAIKKEKRKYKFEELAAVGMTKVEESTCTACHNDKGPTFDAGSPFDYEKMKEQGIHDRIELKLKEG